MSRKIFAVEDDSAIRELYTYTLETEFECRCFENAKAFFAALESELPDLVLLDIMLPGAADEDGFGILTRLKAGKDTADIPVIMVSAKGEELSKVKGLNLGADDYIAKPFGVLELVARVKANLRKTSRESKSETLVYKDIEVDLLKHRVTVNGTPVQTTLKEYNLLHLLCKNAERVQEREAIFTAVWGEVFIGETRTLDIHIKELRKKLAGADSKVVIQTVRGVGYILL